MKFLSLGLIFASVLVLSSCYTATITVGSGPTSGVTAKAKNNYFIFGLATGKQADYKALADNQENYQIEIKHSFVDGLLSGITFGIYNPTTVTISK